jgi:hypothetical protein
MASFAIFDIREGYAFSHKARVRETKMQGTGFEPVKALSPHSVAIDSLLSKDRKSVV